MCSLRLMQAMRIMRLWRFGCGITRVAKRAFVSIVVLGEISGV